MSLLTHLFLESPWPIYVGVGLAWLITYVVWQSRRSRIWAALLVAWPLLAVGVGLVAYVVETPIEKSEAVWTRTATAIENRDVPGILKEIAENFTSDRSNKADIEKLAAKAVGKFGAFQVVFGPLEFTSANDRKVTATVLISAAASQLTTTWELTFGPQADGGWRLTGARCLKPRGLTIQDAVNSGLSFGG
jgi:hypothetical protein